MKNTKIKSCTFTIKKSKEGYMYIENATNPNAVIIIHDMKPKSATITIHIHP